MDRILDDLLTCLLRSNKQTNGKPVVQGTNVATARKELMRVLADRDVLNGYLEALGERTGPSGAGGPRHTEPLPRDRGEALLSTGPQALEPEDLAALLLNPLALGMAHGALIDRALGLEDGDLADPWLDALANETERERLAAALLVCMVYAYAKVSRTGRRSEYPDAEEPYWQLQPGKDVLEVTLPEALAQRCYGTTTQAVQLSLHQRTGAGDRLKLLVEPGPRQAPLSVTLTFPGGFSPTLTVETVYQEDTPGSAELPPLPAERTFPLPEGQELRIEIR